MTYRNMLLSWRDSHASARMGHCLSVAGSTGVILTVHSQITVRETTIALYNYELMSVTGVCINL